MHLCSLVSLDGVTHIRLYYVHYVVYDVICVYCLSVTFGLG